MRHERGVALNVDGNDETFDAAIVAVAPHQLAAAIGDGASADAAWQEPLAQVASLSWESITTIYLAYAEPVSLAMPIMRLDDAPGQWVFDRAAALLQDHGVDEHPLEVGRLVRLGGVAGDEHLVG